MKSFKDLINECLKTVPELFPWDVQELLSSNPDLVLLDIREPDEFNAMHIAGSFHIPRGILESACEYDYEETVPELVEAREQEIVVICRSGYRSALAAHVMQLMGYKSVYSMKTGLRGWSDYELPLVDHAGKPVIEERAEEFFTVRLRPDQHKPQS